MISTRDTFTQTNIIIWLTSKNGYDFLESYKLENGAIFFLFFKW